MKPTVEQEYFSLYMRMPGDPPPKPAMISAIKYHRSCMMSGKYIDGTWNAGHGRGNRALRRAIAILDAVNEFPKWANFSLGGWAGWHRANELGLRHDNSTACILLT